MVDIAIRVTYNILDNRAFVEVLALQEAPNKGRRAC